MIGECRNISIYRACSYLLRPENPRMGFLMEQGYLGQI